MQLLTIRDAGTVPFEYQDTSQLPGSSFCCFHSVSSDGEAQPEEFPLVRGENGCARSSTQYILMPGNEVYSIGIQYNGTFCLAQHPLHHRFGSLRLPQTTAHQNRIHLRKSLFQLLYGIVTECSTPVGQRKNDGLVQLNRFDGIDALRHPKKHQSGAGAQGTHGRKIGCAGITPAAAEQKNFSEISLMGVIVPVRQQGENSIVIQYHA